MPFPNDQFSFATSTSETNTSSRRTPGVSANNAAMRAKRAFFISTVRPALMVIWMRSTPSVRGMSRYEGS